MSKISRQPVLGLAVASFLMAGSAGAAESKAAPTVKDKVTKEAKDARDYVKEGILNSKVRVAMLKNLKGADALRVNIDVEGTRVTLSGEVEQRASEKLAGEVARSVEGVTKVQSNIKLNPKAPQQDGFEAKIKDQMLEADVRVHLLGDVGSAGLTLKVEAASGVVSLRGPMADAALKERALKSAKETPGVTSVQDLLTVN